MEQVGVQWSTAGMWLFSFSSNKKLLFVWMNTQQEAWRARAAAVTLTFSIIRIFMAWGNLLLCVQKPTRSLMRTEWSSPKMAAGVKKPREMQLWPITLWCLQEECGQLLIWNKLGVIFINLAVKYDFNNGCKWQCLGGITHGCRWKNKKKEVRIPILGSASSKSHKMRKYLWVRRL